MKMNITQESFFDLSNRYTKNQFKDSIYGTKITLEEALELSKTKLSNFDLNQITKTTNDYEERKEMLIKVQAGISKRNEQNPEIIKDLNFVIENCEKDIEFTKGHMLLVQSIYDKMVEEVDMFSKRVENMLKLNEQINII